MCTYIAYPPKADKSRSAYKNHYISESGLDTSAEPETRPDNTCSYYLQLMLVSSSAECTQRGVSRTDNSYLFL